MLFEIYWCIVSMTRLRAFSSKWTVISTEGSEFWGEGTGNGEGWTYHFSYLIDLRCDLDGLSGL